MDYSDRHSTIVYLASDHGGFLAKEFAKELIIGWGYKIHDLGTNSEESVDYPDYGVRAGRAVLHDSAGCAVIFCGTGIGISITANKVPGIRAALCTNNFHAEMARRHNDANIIAMGGRVSSFQEIEAMLKIWFSTPFEGGRHEKRVRKIHELTGV